MNGRCVIIFHYRYTKSAAVFIVSTFFSEVLEFQFYSCWFKFDLEIIEFLGVFEGLLEVLYIQAFLYPAPMLFSLLSPISTCKCKKVCTNNCSF